MDSIFGYSWSDIQRAQQGGRLSKPIDVSKPARASDTNDAQAQEDLRLLDQHGAIGLRRMGYMGVLDRLERRGLIARA